MLFPIYAVLVLGLSSVYGMNDVIKELLTPSKEMDETCGYSSCPVAPKGIQTFVHVVPHTHAELGQTQGFYSYYTGDDDTYEHTTQNMKQILDYTISELWASPTRKFTFSDMPYFFYWWARRDETVRRMVYELIRQGRLNFVGGGWSMSDEATTSYHAIIDHFTFTLRKINASFLECARPLVAWQIDAVGHSREFASLMAQMGYDGLFISPIGFDEELARIQRKEMEFMWRGSDDLGPETDIFTHVPFDGMGPPPGFCFSSFCDDPLLITSLGIFGNVMERVEEFITTMQHRQAPYYSTRNVMVLMGTRLAYSDASMWFENIDKLIQHLNFLSGAKSIYASYSTPFCYLKSVYDENPTLRSKQDDFFPQAISRTSYATGAHTSRPSLKLLAREGHKYLQMAKQLLVTADLGDHYGQMFEDFHWIHGVFQDHHVITGSLWPKVMNFYLKRMSAMIGQASMLMGDAFNKLRFSPTDTMYHRCEFNISACYNTCGKQHFVVVYNPLAWPVTMLVRLPIRTRLYIVYNHLMKRVPTAMMPIPDPVLMVPERNTLSDLELIFRAEDIPPLGYRSYYIRRRFLGWQRPRRSLIKKINQNKPKKYLVRQTNPPPDSGILFSEPEYEDFEDTQTSTTPHYEIVFGEVSRHENESMFSDILTPKTRLIKTTTDLPMDTTTHKLDITTVESVTTSGEVERTTRNELVTRTTTDRKAWTQVTRTVPVTAGTTSDADTIDKLIQSFNTHGFTSDLSATPEPMPSTTKTPITRRTRRTPRPRMRATRTTPQPASSAKETAAKKNRTDDDDDDDSLWKGYAFNNVTRPFIRNRYIRVNLNATTRQIMNISIANGIRMPFDIKMYYYVSDDPVALKKENTEPPGAYVFRSMDNKEEHAKTPSRTNIYKSRLAQEMHVRLTAFTSYSLRLHMHSPVLEVDWLVGPIPVEDGLGKDVFIKYVTNISNNGVFYTDSNGRQTIKRMRNRRPTYEAINEDPVSGNMYPVTSKIFIEDLKKNVRFSVLTDRAQGGSSLKDGEINIMLHRRLLTQDPIRENMNDTAYGKGVVIRGTHYIYISKADNKPTKVFEKKLAKEIELRPTVFVSQSNGYGLNTRNIWKNHSNEFSALKSKLPVGVHILTIEKWGLYQLLLRLENYLEKYDCVLSGVKSVYLNELFTNITFVDIKEMTLGANVMLKDWNPLDWKKQLFVKSFNEYYGSDAKEFAEDNARGLEEVELDKPVVLNPQQIRTFILTYVFER